MTFNKNQDPVLKIRQKLVRPGDMFYVYAHRRNDTNEIFYIGKGHDRRAYRSNYKNRHWHFVVDKHGYSVEILYTSNNEKLALDLEAQIISEEWAKGTKLVNILPGGEGMPKGYKRSAEHTRKIVLSQIGRPNPNGGARLAQNYKFAGTCHTPYGVFDTLAIAAKTIGIPYQTLVSRCNSTTEKWALWFTRKELNNVV